MSGVFATTRPDLWRERAPQVLSLLRHRGPNGSGVWQTAAGEALLCHTRLSVQERRSDDARPTVLPGGEALSLDGEVHETGRLADSALPNARAVALRIAAGGLQTLGRLRGTYALAYWDPVTRSLSAARDPWGVKPLYLLDHPSGGVTLSSEIRPLRLHPDGREADPIGIAQYVAFGHTLPQFTCHLRIRKLCPGVVYTWSLAGDDQVDLSLQKVDQPDPDRSIGTEVALEDSIDARLALGAELGAFLSAGTGSTLMTAMASKLAPRLRSFTIAFPEIPAIDESAEANANANALGIEHTVVPVRAQEMVRFLDDFLAVAGEPMGEPTALPLFCLAREAAQTVNVVVAGSGAKEVFGGYDRYRVSRLLPQRSVPVLSELSGKLADVVYDRIGSRNVESLLRLDGARGHAALLGSDLSTVVRTSPIGSEVDTLLRTDWEGSAGNGRALKTAQTFDRTRWLPNTHLEALDRATMAASLEARTPFLDPVVVSAAAPGRPLGRDGLHRLLEQLLPGHTLAARKIRSTGALDSLLANSLSEDLARVTCSSHSVLQQTLGTRAAEELARRARFSPSTAYRLAVLGRWEEVADVHA